MILLRGTSDLSNLKEFLKTEKECTTRKGRLALHKKAWSGKRLISRTEIIYQNIAKQTEKYCDLKM